MANGLTAAQIEALNGLSARTRKESIGTSVGAQLPTAAEKAIVGSLSSNANGEGASQIGIEDAGGLITATDVEGALAELAGAGGYTPAQPDTTHSPVGLFLFDGDYQDSSGNGRHLTLATGTERYSPGAVPGTLGVGLNGTRYQTNDSAFIIDGDITIMICVVFYQSTGDLPIVTCSGSGESTATNHLYGIWQYNQNIKWFNEYGAGSNNQILFTKSFINIGIEYVIAMRRSGSNLSLFFEGELVETIAIGNPPGVGDGTSNYLTVGGEYGAGGAGKSVVSNLKIVASALSDAQIKAEADRIRGISS